MKVIINGKSKDYQPPLKIYRVLEQEGFMNKTISVALNGQFVPKARYLITTLQDGDEIEVVSAMQGG